MDSKNSASVLQNDAESLSSKKIKSHKPIILLRRNSCGNIESKTASPNAGLLYLKKMSDANIASMYVKAEKKNDSHFPVESFSNENTCKKKLNSVVKYENVTSIAVQLKKQVKEEVAVKQSDSTSMNAEYKEALSQNKPTSVSTPIQTQMTIQKTFLQPNYISLEPNQSALALSQHFQTPQIVNPQLNSLFSCPKNMFQPQSDLSCNHYLYPSVVKKQDSPHQFAVQNNRQVFSQPSSAHGMVSEGTVVQTFPNSMLQMQNSNLQVNDSCNVLSNCHSPIIQGTESVSDDSLTNITWLGRMGMNNFMPVPLESERKPEIRHHENSRRPPYSYMALIQFAINSSVTGKMTLRQIYQWIEEKFPYFKTAKPGWKNSIRHNLSLHDLFVREVTTGSKASYWTLRPDLNTRPLTLDSVGTSTSQCSVWSLQTNGQGQKPILPRLPYCPQPYVLLPVPLLQNSKNAASSGVKLEGVNQLGHETSLLLDSGCDASHTTPSSSSKTYSNISDSSLMLHNDSGISFLQSEKKAVPLLSQTSAKSGKRARKEPLRTLNDSLNSSLHFVKEEVNSTSNQSFPSSDGKVLKKVSNLKENDSSKPMNVGLSDESFSELLNDLGSPFKSYLTQESLRNGNTSPKLEIARKRRRSWGSPECSGSGADFQQKLKAANEKTPVRHHIRRVKSDLVDLAQVIKNEDCLPTSTPLNKENWKKIANQRKITCGGLESKENISSKRHLLEVDENWRRNENTSCGIKLCLPPSPIPNIHGDSDINNDFFKDIIGSVFKTPDKPSAPVRHFASLTPDRIPFGSITGYVTNTNSVAIKEQEDGNKAEDTLPIFSAASPATEEPLNTSFSKLLDISGCSSGFGRFSDADLNLGWNNFPNM